MTLADNLREVSAVQASVEEPSKVGRVPQPPRVQTGVSQPVGDGQEGGQQSLELLPASCGRKDNQENSCIMKK